MTFVLDVESPMGDIMRKTIESMNEVAWVDIYPKPFFEGQFVRLWPHSDRKRMAQESDKFVQIGSIIVGPKAIAEFKRQGNSQIIRLLQKTILPDAKSLLKGKGIQSIRVEPVIL
jgi:hypothetical protein